MIDKIIDYNYHNNPLHVSGDHTEEYCGTHLKVSSYPNTELMYVCLLYSDGDDYLEMAKKWKPQGRFGKRTQEHDLTEGKKITPNHSTACEEPSVER